MRDTVLRLRCLVAGILFAVAANSAFAATPPPGDTAAAPPVAVQYQSFTLKLADGASLAYYVRPGTGPTLALIPGSWGDVRTFDGLVPGLSTDLQIVVVELRGHGKSAPATMNGSIELFADDVLRVINQLKPARFFVGGHSIGGMIAIEIAGRKPDHLAGVISMEGWTHWTVQKEAFGGAARVTLSDAQRNEMEAAKRRGQAHMTKEQIDAFSAIWKRWDGSRILESTSVPVLEIWGDRGLPRPTLNQLRIPDRPTIAVAWIANASHSFLIERPGDVALAINRFLVSPGRPSQ